jgi:acetylornithine/N-succinyldiaminopimelate aminotransferase
MNLDELQALEQRYLMQTYRRAPVEFVRGEGALLWDSEGKEYLDFLAGISVCSVGHCHPAVVAAVREQAGKLMHVSNLFYTEPMVRLAERLSASSLGGKVFLTNSGAEANECAIKLARKHANRRGIENPEVVSFERDFHGRTYGALAATPKLAENEALGPMLPGFRSVPFDDAGALREAVYEDTAAVMIEPIQGESGIYPLADETLLAAREACDEAGALLILGSLWAYQQTPVRPDLLTSAKALGGGLPVGACVAAEELGDVLEAGDHASTFAGGPVVSAAALAVLELVDDAALLRGVRELGAGLRDALLELEGVVEVRGRGLMLGVGLADGIDATALGAGLLERGLIVNVPEPGTLRLLPPLTVDSAQIERAVGLIGESLLSYSPA